MAAKLKFLRPNTSEILGFVSDLKFIFVLQESDFYNALGRR